MYDYSSANNQDSVVIVKLCAQKPSNLADSNPLKGPPCCITRIRLAFFYMKQAIFGFYVEAFSKLLFMRRSTWSYTECLFVIMHIHPPITFKTGALLSTRMFCFRNPILYVRVL